MKKKTPRALVPPDLTSAAIQQDFLHNLFYRLAQFHEVATQRDHYLALSYAVRNRLLHRWLATVQTYYRQACRTVCYLSAEFLLGPQLANNLLNLGILEQARQAMDELGVNLDALIESEAEPGLGNGGLGRLAACYLDSLATLSIPTIGYGIRYEFGIFEQEIRDGRQVERTDAWLRLGNPWEIARPEVTCDVKLGGHAESYVDREGRFRVRWVPGRMVRGMAHDVPILGFGVTTANLLRLWKAEAPERFELDAFNAGDYYGAVRANTRAENLSKILYPNDNTVEGRVLRLEQQYFFVACSLHDMIRIHLQRAPSLDNFHDKYAVQLNDTHPAVAIAELMRLLVDEYDFDWERAWTITRRTFSYTNHTLLPEALEAWPVELFERVLPRHLQIVVEINRRFLAQVRARHPGDEAQLARVSLISNGPDRVVRMAHLACVGSHAVNGVAELHSELLKTDVLRDLAAEMPGQFHNVTNGITPRRFLLLDNPRLSALIREAIGDAWVRDLEALRHLEPFANDAAFRERWHQIKLANKRDLARRVLRSQDLTLSPASLFDVQVKRIHEYKRQHLNVLHVVHRYLRARRTLGAVAPRTFIFAGKAAPGYVLAKQIIHLIHAVARTVNADPAIAGAIKVVFLPNFNVKNAGHVYPAADLSEQISTAGKEASGTGNMKLALNGALTIGTLDGANVEIRAAVGHENFFLFGLSAAQAAAAKHSGYDPRQVYASDPELREAVDLIASGFFSDGDPTTFRPLIDSLLLSDPFLVLADFGAYVACQDEVDAVFADQDQWTRRSILNVSRMGHFSSDRAIREYCEKIWRVRPVTIDLDPDGDGWPGVS